MTIQKFPKNPKTMLRKPCDDSKQSNHQNILQTKIHFFTLNVKYLSLQSPASDILCVAATGPNLRMTQMQRDTADS